LFQLFSLSLCLTIVRRVVVLPCVAVVVPVCHDVVVAVVLVCRDAVVAVPALPDDVAAVAAPACRDAVVAVVPVCHDAVVFRLCT
jgi:hypothetical protein